MPETDYVDDPEVKDLYRMMYCMESKIDALNESIMKVVYALLAIVAATVGVEFIPRSPVDWVGASDFMGKFIGIFSMAFLAIRILSLCKRINGHKVCLGVGLLALSMVLMTGWLMPHTVFWFWVRMMLRLIYAPCLVVYAWFLEEEVK